MERHDKSKGFKKLLKSGGIDEDTVKIILEDKNYKNSYIKALVKSEYPISYDFAESLISILTEFRDFETINILTRNLEERVINESFEEDTKNIKVDVSKRFDDKRGISPIFYEMMINPCCENKKLQDSLIQHFQTFDQVADEKENSFRSKEILLNILKTIQKMPKEDKEYLHNLLKSYPNLKEELNSRSRGQKLGDRIFEISLEKTKTIIF